jgi:20S proteasome alpha/beta subunit
MHDTTDKNDSDEGGENNVTLLVALKGSDGMVLAADSRGTFGDPRSVTAQNDAQQKAHILAPHVAVLVAGSGEVGALVIDLVRQEVTAQAADGATPVLNILRDTVRKQYENWFKSIPAIQPLQLIQSGQVAIRPELAFIVGGYELDGTSRIFGLGSLFDFSPMLYDYGFAVQGIAQYALYLLNRLYERGRTIDELKPLAIYVITETASQDGKVGGPVNVITIKPGSEGCQPVPPEIVQQIQKANESRSRALRDSFYRREVEKP